MKDFMSPFVQAIHELLEPLGFKSETMGTWDALEGEGWSVVVIDDYVITRKKAGTTLESTFRKLDLNDPKSLDELVKMVKNE